MKVYKFGGASVKDAGGIRNLAKIVSEEKDDMVVVVSAFGKTTNALEQVLKKWLEGDRCYRDYLDNIYSYHASVADDLFSSGNSAREKIDISFAELREYLLSAKKSHYDYDYDQVVSFGELWSTAIVAGYLRESGLSAEWIDIRKSLITDDSYRDANVLWNESQSRIKTVFDFSRSPLFVTQGFIGGTVAGKATTLGREGSDYTAALLASMLEARSVTVWKDVPGLLNADPKWLPDACRLEEISYKEAVEMTFSGAKVIHPKTIKPLHNKNIPLYVKCFIDPSAEGTIVRSDATLKKVMPVFVRKENQILISILPRDFSFVMGDNLSMIFQLFLNNGIKVNLVEASAISLDVCVDDERSRVEVLLEDLDSEYTALYNENVELLTVRHYTPEAITRITSGREVLLEQRTRSTVRFVVRQDPPTPLKGG
ncbi:MAG: aspartate kinase [Bacteroidales bacterium]|nr:aspartate kinase [Bacteroidales bacterium]